MRGSCRAFAWAIASPRRSSSLRATTAFKCPDLHGWREAKTPLQGKQEEQEAPRSLLKAPGAAAALLHSLSHHQRAITAHICSLVWASAASWLMLTSVFSLDWCRVKNGQFFQLISLLSQPAAQWGLHKETLFQVLPPSCCGPLLGNAKYRTVISSLLFANADFILPV